MSAMGDLWLELRAKGIKSPGMMQLYLDEIAVKRGWGQLGRLRAAGKVKELRRVIRLVKKSEPRRQFAVQQEG